MHAQPAFALRRLHFVPAQRQDAHSAGADLSGLIPLNDPVEVPAEQGKAMPRPGTAKAGGRQPRKELFDAAELSLQWREMRKAGVGLQNLGNTCFMNSVLQSLVHTPPLAELLLSAGSGRLHNGAVNGFYPIQLAQELVKRSLGQPSRSPMAPMQFAKSLRRISRSFRLGRQEDAHEFLIALLDAMHEASIAGMQPKPPPELAQTSFIYRIFGGRMRSQVKCSECGYESNTYDPCIDLSLEITRAQTVKRALERFTAGEVLDGSNKYKCPKQNKGVRAVKRMTVDAAPNVLMIQLKRFEFSFSGHKISKKVDFDLELDLSPYMSERPKTPAVYDLYAVLVHSGHSVHSGHYYSYVRAPNGMWHICDDTHVAQVAERQVMAQKAYILFYLKRQPKGLPAAPRVRPASAGPEASPVAVPSLTAAAAAAAKPAAALRSAQDVQQQQQQQLEQQQQQLARQKVKPVPAAAEPAAEAVAKKRKRQADGSAAAKQLPPDAARPAAGGSEQPPRRDQQSQQEEEAQPRQQQQQQQQENGRISKKLRLRALKRSGDKEAHLSHSVVNGRLASPLVLLRGYSALVGRSGSRLAEAISISQNPPSRKIRERQRAAAAAAAAAAGQAAVGSPPRPTTASNLGSRSGSEGDTTTTAVVAAPVWPPVRSQGAAAAAAAGDSDAQEQQRKPELKTKRTEQARGGQQQQQQQQQEQRAQQGAAPPAGAQSNGDVRSLLRSSGGGARLPLQSWDEASPDAKRLKAELERKEAPKRRRLDAYDVEYDMGKVKKVRSKPAAGEDGGGGVDGRTFDAAWSRKQREGVSTDLRGSRKRRSADFKQQQQQQQQRRFSGGGRHGRGGGRGRGGRGGRGGSRGRH